LFDAASSAGFGGSLEAQLIVESGLVLLGSVLAFNPRGISSKLYQNSSGFTPWGKSLKGTFPNPVRIAGAFFLIVGIFTLIPTALHA
jgi:hypothetical protein